VGCVACIPSRLAKEDTTTSSQTHTHKPYRSSPPLFSKDLFPQLCTNNNLCLTQTETSSSTSRVEPDKANNQQDNYNNSEGSGSAVSSTNSNISTHEKREDDDMHSVGSLSNSSSSTSLAMTTGDVPALPAKSALRASRLLASMPQKKTPSDDQPMLPHAAPHQVYLSSEEDASSSADDFSDFEDEIESEGEGSQKTSVRSITREDTARMVAVIFHGKPSIVTLSPRRSISPSSSDVHQESRIPQTTTEPYFQRPRSVSSTSSIITPFSRPPRSSSMMAAFEKKRPHFLQIDPHAEIKKEQKETSKTPKTPTGMILRTLSLVKKRSKQNFHHSETLIKPMEKVGEAEEEGGSRESIYLEPGTPEPVKYQDIMKSAQRNASLSRPRSEVPSAVSPKKRLRAGLSLGRQRSVRA
jgi:hypothetical protein